MRSGKGVKADLLRRIDESAPELWPLPGPDAALASEVRFVEPMDANWAWSPTSANCFRRDAVKLFLNKKSLGDLLGCLDSYLLRGISVLTGSVLIDRPLVYYRIHGSNIFSKHPTLNGVVNFERGGKYDEEQHCRKMLINHMIANASSFLTLLPSIDYYMRALGALNDLWPRLCPSGVPCESRSRHKNNGRIRYVRWTDWRRRDAVLAGAAWLQPTLADVCKAPFPRRQCLIPREESGLARRLRLLSFGHCGGNWRWWPFRAAPSPRMDCASNPDFGI